jgi:hypothetical protein
LIRASIPEHFRFGDVTEWIAGSSPAMTTGLGDISTGIAMTFEQNLKRLRKKYGADSGGDAVRDPKFKKVADKIFDPKGTRIAPYAGISTFMAAPIRAIDWKNPDFGDLQVAALGIPMDLGVTNRNGARFGPRAVRTIERIGPYNHVLETAPVFDLKLADIGDIPFRSRFNLEASHEDIERHIRLIVEAGVAPLSVGGDHSMTLPILRSERTDRSVWSTSTPIATPPGLTR